MTSQISIKDSFSFAWNAFKAHWMLFCFFTLLIIGVQFGEKSLLKNFPDSQISLLFLSATLAIVFQMTLIRICLAIYDKEEKPSFKYLFSNKPLIFLRYISAVFLWGLILSFCANFLLSSFQKFPQSFAIAITCLISFLFIYLSLRFLFFNYYLLEETSFSSSIASSFRITKGKEAKLFLFLLFLVLINFLGVLTFGIGLLITLPLSILATTQIYRTLSPRNSCFTPG